MPEHKVVIYPWNLAANHWLSRSLQAIWLIAIVLAIWAVTTHRPDAPLFLVCAAGATFLAWAAYIVWKKGRRQSANANANAHAPASDNSER